MTEAKKIAIADAAEMIVGGYAFLRKGDNITIVNLNRDDEHVMVITKELNVCMLMLVTENLPKAVRQSFLFWKMVPQLYKTEEFSMIEKFSRFKSSLNCTIWKCMRSGQRTVKKDFMVKTNKCHRHNGVLLYAA